MTQSKENAWLQLRDRATFQLTRDVLEAHLGASPWLIVVPHDDDLVLGSGLLLTLASAQGIDVHVAVCTDGSLGYTRPEDAAELARTRRREMGDAMGALGMDPANLHWLGFEDGRLSGRLGARPQPQAMGLGQALARQMRSLRPGLVMSCHDHDVHPDHRAVAWDTSIACFWASSEIWLELGEPIALPRHWLYGVYAGFDSPPDVRVVGHDGAQRRKLAALRCFESQGVIRDLVVKIESDGPLEFFKAAVQAPHGPDAYASAFGPLPGANAGQ